MAALQPQNPPRGTNLPQDGTHPNRNKGKSKSKNRNKLFQRAQRHVQLAHQPELDAIERQVQQVLDEFDQAQQAGQSAYGGYQKLIEPYGAEYTAETGSIADRLIGQLGQNQAQLAADPALAQYGSPALGVGQGLPQAEGQAGVGMYGAIGDTALGQISNMAARNLGYQTSAQREGGLAKRSMQSNLIQQMNDAMRELQGRELDVTGQFAGETLDYLGTLKQQALENQLVKSKMESDQAYADYLMGTINRALGDGDGEGSGFTEGGRPAGWLPTVSSGGPGGAGGRGGGGGGGPAPGAYAQRVSNLRGTITGAEGVGGLPEWLRPYATVYQTDPDATFNDLADVTYGGNQLTRQQQRLYNDPRVRNVLRRQFPKEEPEPSFYGAPFPNRWGI